MRQLLQEKQLKLLFSAFICSYLEYDALAWGGAVKRLTCLKAKNHITKPLYKYYKILPRKLNI